MPRRPIVSGAASQGAELRDALARWATGVAVVAVRAEGVVHAMTVSAFVPLSLDPALIGVAIGRHAPLASLLQQGEPFTLSVLAAGQKRWANVFSDTFPVDRSGFPPAGDPVLAGSLAALACVVSAVHPAGDHVLVVGAVQNVTLGPPGEPLLYYERQYRTLPEPG